MAVYNAHMAPDLKMNQIRFAVPSGSSAIRGVGARPVSLAKSRHWVFGAKELFVDPLRSWVSRQPREPADPNPAGRELSPPVKYALTEVLHMAAWREVLPPDWHHLYEALSQRDTARWPLLDGTALADLVPAVRRWVAESLASLADSEQPRTNADPEELVESLSLRILRDIRRETTHGAGLLTALWNDFRETQLGERLAAWRDHWNPPGTVAGFVGREAELAALHRDERPLWLFGAGGVGKTALAVSYAEHVSAAFDGRVLVDFGAGDERPKTAVVALREVLSAIDPRLDLATLHSMDSAELEAAWRAAATGKRLFMLWDNVTDPAQIEPLLVDQPGSRTIVTARQPRGAMRQMRLDVLDPHQAGELLTRISEIDDRAAVARIAAADGYSPVAVEIHALGLRDGAYSPRQLLAELEGSRWNETQGALDERIDIAYRRLTSPAQRVLRMFGIHPGRVLPVATIAKMSGNGFGEAARLLEILETSGLLRCHDKAFDDTSMWTYRAGDQVRDFVRTRVESSESDKIRAELTTWYLDRFDTIMRSLRHLDVELPAMMAFVLSRDEVPYAQMALSLGSKYDRTGRYAESESVLRHAAEIFDRRGFAAGAGEARFLLSQVASARGDIAAAAARMETAVNNFRAGGHMAALGTATWAWAQLELHSGHIDVARERLEAAARVFGVIGDHDGADSVRAVAKSDGQTALRMYHEVCARRGVADRRRVLAEIVMAEGDLPEATVLLALADSTYGGADHGPGLADDTLLRGELALRQSTPARARQRFEEARVMYREMGNRHGIACALTGLADVAVATDDLGEAWRLLCEALNEFTAIGAESDVERCRLKVSYVERRLG